MFLRALKWLSMLFWILLCNMSKIMLFLHKKGALEGKEIWLGCSVCYPLCAEAVIAKKQSCCYLPNSFVILLWWWLEEILICNGSWKTKSDFASSALVLCKKNSIYKGQWRIQSSWNMPRLLYLHSPCQMEIQHSVYVLKG